MRHVVFIAPRFLENTNGYVKAFAELDGITLSLISMDPEQAIPREHASRVAGHYRVDDCMKGAQLTVSRPWLDIVCCATSTRRPRHRRRGRAEARTALWGSSASRFHAAAAHEAEASSARGCSPAELARYASNGAITIGVYRASQ